MSDLIKRADAIEAVAGAIWHYPNQCYKDLNVYEFAEALAKDALSALPSAEVVQGWIPCSERLPSAEDCPMDCMVTRRSKYVGNYTDMAVAEADGTWTHEDWKAIAIKGEATCISTRDADIIAWMPLPKPYREDGEV